MRPRDGVHLSPRGDQPFVDGNKRTALASGLVFLHQNGIALEDPEERLYDVMISVATKAIGKPEIAAALRSLVAPVSG